MDSTYPPMPITFFVGGKVGVFVWLTVRISAFFPPSLQRFIYLFSVQFRRSNELKPCMLDTDLVLVTRISNETERMKGD